MSINALETPWSQPVLILEFTDTAAFDPTSMSGNNQHRRQNYVSDVNL